ncbi:DUF3404 domain-containing protein [Aeromonas jandaei]|uniref:DUF3404 domain-containing protein n=1 Tax=Aeromonas jandaei TaxID=650 RepID=UPI003EC7E865
MAATAASALRPRAAPSTRWFAAHPIYPLGGSSAARWLARYPTAVLNHLLHVRERRDRLGQLGELDDDNLDALLRGERWLLQSGQLWLLADGQWRRYGAGQWQPLAERLGVTLDSRTAGTCEERVGAICFNTRPTLGWQWLALASSLGFILLLGWASWQRWRLLRERRVALQMLTHELRTPIMALSGISEELRHDFDRLPLPPSRAWGNCWAVSPVCINWRRPVATIWRQRLSKMSGWRSVSPSGSPWPASGMTPPSVLSGR